MVMVLTPLIGIPLIQPGDDLATIILQAMDRGGLEMSNGDVLVIAQKIISKSEGRFVNLEDVTPSQQARALAQKTGKDPRLVELVLRESSQVVRSRPGSIVVEHRLGFICASAGIDHSNVRGDENGGESWVLLLPEDPDRSAENLRLQLESETGKRISVMVIDSHGRAWRLGTVGLAIGISGIPGLVDLRGEPDLFGYRLQITQVGVADELAAAASLVMGQAAEGTPAVHVRGFPYPLREGKLGELIRPKEEDMFR
jgi:coenzyme F420-0:L-glutamate ligase / coenzyme F420-1:gamma-L-glutamate ligase